MSNQITDFNDDGPEELDLTADTGTDGGPEDRGDNLDGAPADRDDGDQTKGDAAETDAKGNGAKIPKGRLNEVISQRDNIKSERDALKEQLAEANRRLEANQGNGEKPESTPAPAQAPNVELKALRTRYREALMEGDLDTAAELDDLIDTEVIRIAELKIEEKQANRASQSALQVVSDQAVTDYPYLDTEAGAEALSLIVMMRDQKIMAGMAPGKALKEAVQSIAPRFAPANDDGSPLYGLQAERKAADTREANATARGAADSNLQPPSMQAGVGNRATNTKVDVNRLSEGQFKDLSDADKRRMRGD